MSTPGSSAAPLFPTNRRPSFWPDVEVRNLVISLRGEMTMDMAMAVIRERFGASRAPSRSAMGRVWKALRDAEARS